MSRRFQPAGEPGETPAGWCAALEQFRSGLHAYLSKRLRHSQNAAELAQEVYLRLLRVEKPERVKSPQAYMYRVAANALQEFRAREEANPVAFDSNLVERVSGHLIDDAAAPDRACEQDDEIQGLDEVIAKLPPMQRKVLLMATCQGLPHGQIARELGISLHTVRNHLYRALYFCRQELKG